MGEIQVISQLNIIIFKTTRVCRNVEFGTLIILEWVG